MSGEASGIRVEGANGASRRTLLADVLVILSIIVASGCISLAWGQDLNTDLLRYRFYIGYAYVHGRLGYDLAPASLGTYLNPVLDAAHYLGITHLAPRVFGFLLGAFQGLNAVLIFLMARRLLERRPASWLLAVLAGALAVAGPNARSLAGTTTGDTTASVPALLALLLLVGDRRFPDRTVRGPLLLAVGLLGGAAVGLKLTMGVYVVALAAVVAMLIADRRVSPGAAVAFPVGAVLGYLALAGHWCWLMWERFGNPLFPLANNIFRSPYLPAEAIRDMRWAAQGPLDYLTPPFQMAIGATIRLQEIPFCDARFLLVLLAGVAWLVLRLAGRRAPLPPGQRHLLLYVLVGYVTWLVAFYYYRYATVLEYLAPLVLVVLVPAVLPRFGRAVLLLLAGFLLLSTSVGSWGRYGWRKEWWRMKLPALAHVPNNLVLVDSTLNSFVLPYFPEDTRFAGLEGTGSDRLEQELADLIASHEGSLMVLVSWGEAAQTPNLRRFGLTAIDDCGRIRTGKGKKLLCRVVRSSAGRQPPSPARP